MWVDWRHQPKSNCTLVDFFFFFTLTETEINEWFVNMQRHSSMELIMWSDKIVGEGVTPFTASQIHIIRQIGAINYTTASR